MQASGLSRYEAELLVNVAARAFVCAVGEDPRVPPVVRVLCLEGHPVSNSRCVEVRWGPRAEPRGEGGEVEGGALLYLPSYPLPLYRLQFHRRIASSAARSGLVCLPPSRPCSWTAPLPPEDRARLPVSGASVAVFLCNLDVSAQAEVLETAEGQTTGRGIEIAGEEAWDSAGAQLEALEDLVAELSAAGVGVLASQRTIHPRIRAACRASGVLALERLSARHVGAFCRAAGATPMGTRSLGLVPEWRRHLGRLGALEALREGGQDLLLVAPKAPLREDKEEEGQGSPRPLSAAAPVSTILLGGPNELVLQVCLPSMQLHPQAYPSLVVPRGQRSRQRTGDKLLTAPVSPLPFVLPAPAPRTASPCPSLLYLQEMKSCLEAAVQVLSRALRVQMVTPGGGCAEIVMAHRLRAQSSASFGCVSGGRSP